MAYHQMTVKTSKNGFEVYEQRLIDVYLDDEGWWWREVNEEGDYTGALHGPFDTEDMAKDDALGFHGGEGWE